MSTPDFLNPPTSPKHSELEADGFTRRTTAAEPRLSELVEQYREIGHEVELVEFRAETKSCSVCLVPESDCAVSQLKNSKYATNKEPLVYYDIFVRPKAKKQ